jgi:hypothetical protein
MRQAIINSLDILIWVLGALIALAGVVAGIAALAQGQVMGLAILIGGLLYAVVFMGMFFLIIGIHNNTKRTADACERMTAR